ncbi:MAG: TfoX/Sxy family protein [Candidatus Dormibacteria bacterium]
MSPMPGGGMPRPSPAAVSAFQSLVPDASGVTTRPMFGNQAAFVNGNMFAGLFGDALFVRVDEDGRQLLLASGGSDFEPMPGRPMRGYTCLAAGWQSAPEVAGGWVRRGLTYTAALPAKAKASRGRGGAKAAR